MRQVCSTAACLAGVAALLLLEALWVGMGSRKYESAREWAGPEAGRHGTQLLVGAGVFLLVLWSLVQRRRWAWVAARAWAIVMGSLGIFVLLIIVGSYLVSGSQSPGDALV
jgi:hypothetical protein